MMKQINHIKEVELEVITPVHIGTTSDKNYQKGIDYFYQDKTLYFVDLDLLLQAMLERGEEFHTLSNMIESGKFWDVENYLFKTLKIPLEQIAYYRQRLNSKPDNEIQAFIKDGQGKPYIPGSSLKGALRSVFFSYLSKNTSTNIREQLVQDYNRSQNNRRWRASSAPYEATLLGKFDDSIMRFIRVYDAYVSLENTEIDFVSLFNLYNEGDYWESDWKGGFGITLQVLKPKTKATFRLALAEPLIDIIKNKYRKDTPKNIRKIFTGNSFDHIKHLINNHTRTSLEKELEFFSQYSQAEDADKIIEKIEILISYTYAKDSCLLRVGSGSGFHSITGDWRFDNYLDTIEDPDEKNNNKRYKSRKIVDVDLMGFVKLTF